jgi:DNA-binding FrmR family transcriptional regulator
MSHAEQIKEHSIAVIQLISAQTDASNSAIFDTISSHLSTVVQESEMLIAMFM